MNSEQTASIPIVSLNENESRAMLAEHDRKCFIEDCDEKGVQECAGLRTVRTNCVNWMCASHGVIAYKQHWCGGGGCGLEDEDKYCNLCARRAQRDSWIKLVFIMLVLAVIVTVVVKKYTSEQ